MGPVARRAEMRNPAHSKRLEEPEPMTSPVSTVSGDTYEILALKYAELTQRRRYESFIGADDHDQH